MASIPLHHVKQKFCTTRPSYREGREPKAIKVYTVSSESKYLLIQGVPINHGEDLAPIFSIHGEIDELRGIGDYPEKEKFTEVFLIKYKHIQAARFAKRKLDELSFFGGCLHVCYAPEYETVAETRAKLLQRRRIIAIKTSNRKGSSQDAVSSTSVSEVPSACQPQQDLVPQTKPPEFLASSPVLPIVPNLSVPPPLPELFLSKLALPPPHPPPPPLPPPAPSEEPSEKYSLLLPPKHLSKELQTPKVKTKFEYAKVMSAQAMFPVGFDARLPSQSQTVTDNQQVPTLNKASSSLSRNQPNAEKITESNSNLAKDNQVNTENNEKSQLVIRNIKGKISVPKFIPRQAMNKSSHQPQVKGKLDKALRATAVQLGDVQGPELPEEMQTFRKDIQLSLDKTRQEIRKRVSQLSEADKQVVTQKPSKIRKD